jgi:hypothetical protein
VSADRSQWVLVDTCIWSSFFTKPGSREKHDVDMLLDEDRIATTDPDFDFVPGMKRFGRTAR